MKLISEKFWRWMTLKHLNPESIIPMPIKAKPYSHQVEAFNFVCRLFGLVKGGGVPYISRRGAALLMEMG